VISQFPDGVWVERGIASADELLGG
jgi:hypothetical protein